MHTRKMWVAVMCFVFVFVFILGIALAVIIIKDNNETPNTYTIYINTLNDNNGDGSKANPLSNIDGIDEKINEIAKNDEIKKVIVMCNGQFDCLNFDNMSFDVPVKFCAGKDFQLSGGIHLLNADFQKVNQCQDIRIQSDNIYRLDLTKYGITDEEMGELLGIGKYNKEYNYRDDLDLVTQQCELYCNGVRMNIARYKNKSDGFLSIGTVVSSGKGTTGDGGVFYVDETTKGIIDTWQPSSIDNAWIAGYFGNTYADGSSPIGDYDSENGIITTKYAFTYGYVEGRKYYIYNVLETLDSSDEYFIDSEGKCLYIYSSSDIVGDYTLGLSNKNLISMTNCKNIEISGFNLSLSKQSGIVIKNCEDIIVDNCTIKDVTGSGIELKGSNIVIKNNEITNVGKFGVYVSNASNGELKYQNVVINDNDIHDYAQVNKTYCAGIMLDGIGNIAKNNKIYDAPHVAIQYGGNFNIIDGNTIHDICKETGDAGAIYSGRSFERYGNQIINNHIYNFNGSIGIYLDDFISGQIVQDNIIQRGDYVGSTPKGILVGGGRDNLLSGNILIGCSFVYDQRAYAGYEGKNTYYTDTTNGTFWIFVKQGLAKNAKWDNVFSSLATLSSDTTNVTDSSFAINPVSEIKDNIAVTNAVAYNFYTKVKEYSAIDNNKVITNTIAQKAENGAYDSTKLDSEYIRSFISIWQNL